MDSKVKLAWAIARTVTCDAFIERHTKAPMLAQTLAGFANASVSAGEDNKVENVAIELKRKLVSSFLFVFTRLDFAQVQGLCVNCNGPFKSRFVIDKRLADCSFKFF
jgi:hypothetical protein